MHLSKSATSVYFTQQSLKFACHPRQAVQHLKFDLIATSNGILRRSCGRKNKYLRDKRIKGKCHDLQKRTSQTSIFPLNIINSQSCRQGLEAWTIDYLVSGQRANTLATFSKRLPSSSDCILYLPTSANPLDTIY